MTRNDKFIIGTGFSISGTQIDVIVNIQLIGLTQEHYSYRMLVQYAGTTQLLGVMYQYSQAKTNTLLGGSEQLLKISYSHNYNPICI